MVKVRLCFHDRCFDGAASSAVFLRFYRECITRDAEFALTGLTHRAGNLFTPDLFDGDENAIVDFKYSSSPKLSWWFDHHQSAFLSPADAEHFRRDTSGRKFYDPEYKSCTKFLSDVAQRKFGFDSAPLAELIHWGDMIDGAQYASAESAVSLREPATLLALVIEAAPEPGLVARIVPALAERPLKDMLKLPEVERQLPPLLERHEKSLEIFRKRAQAQGRVVYFDLSGDELEGYNKFIPYYLYPNCVYSVGVSTSPLRAKVSVGSNPWTPEPLQHNLAALCERFGGGGHARVAAISLEPHDLEKARAVAQEIAAILRG
ncbi:MAG TPA: hypothetical protein VGR03_01590 [Candidatus Acidoferrum sp.]|nr:hypothetical protein [Candidatus Acidoferrum sp.]